MNNQEVDKIIERVKEMCQCHVCQGSSEYDPKCCPDSENPSLVEGDSIEDMKEYMESQGWKFNKEQPND